MNAVLLRPSRLYLDSAPREISRPEEDSAGPNSLLREEYGNVFKEDASLRSLWGFVQLYAMHMMRHCDRILQVKF